MIRLGTYNVEWFEALFLPSGRLRRDPGPGARHGVPARDQAAALAQVIEALEVDGLMVIEAPDDTRQRSTKVKLEAFAQSYGLRQRVAVTGFANDTQQEIAFLYDPDRLTARHDPRASAEAPAFNARHAVLLNGQREPVLHAKPPLELAVTTREGRSLRLIGVHMKSKAPHGAVGDEAVRRLSTENRRKHLAQCLWLRARVLDHLAAGDSLMVMGDFNDGPGLDDYEALFGQSGVEIVLGWNAPRPERLFDPNAKAALGKKLAAAPATARFWLPETEQFFSALIDYIMVSPDLRRENPRWRIWHPFDDPQLYHTAPLREALLTASDHFPVTLDLP